MKSTKEKILLLENINYKAVETLSKKFKVDYRKEALKKEELLKIINNYKVIGIRAKTKIDKEIIDKAKNLKIIACFMVGTNNIDLEYAKNKNITILNDPTSNTRSVAELVIANILNLSRYICQKNLDSHKGIWTKNEINNSNEILNKTLGIIGYGNIGKQVSKMAECLGMKIYYYDIIHPKPIGNAKEVETIEEILKISDYISIHVPENKHTKGLINIENIKLIKQNSRIINTARGSIIEEEALIWALDTNRILGAAIDVFNDEPNSKKERFQNKLTKYKNVILTPHIGGNTIEAQEKIAIKLSNKILEISN